MFDAIKSFLDRRIVRAESGLQPAEAPSGLRYSLSWRMPMKSSVRPSARTSRQHWGAAALRRHPHEVIPAQCGA